MLWPEALDHTWDFISTRGGARADIDFLGHSINAVRRKFPVDDNRIGIAGISDGGSMALSLATQNPAVFQAAMSSSAGFCVPPPPPPADGSAPRLFLQHGDQDAMFPLQQVGVRNKEELSRAGYDVVFEVAEGQGHVPEGWGETFLSAWLAMADNAAL